MKLEPIKSFFTRRSLSLISALLVSLGSAAHADVNKALSAFQSTCLISPLELNAMRNSFASAGIRSASLNERLLDLQGGEDLKGMPYMVSRSMLSRNRPFVAGCNIVAKGTAPRSAGSVVARVIAGRGYTRTSRETVANFPKPETKELVSGVFEKSGRYYDIFVGTIGRRTFFLVGELP